MQQSSGPRLGKRLLRAPSLGRLRRMAKPPVVVKKYANRRLYDGEESRYVTLEELAAKVKRGADVRVQDAVTGEDLTQATFAQIILESRGGARLLPTALLVQLVRLGDDHLAEFFQRYVSWALEIYLSARTAPSAFDAVTGIATSFSRPFANANPLLRPFFEASPWARGPGFDPRDARPGAPPPPPPPSAPVMEAEAEVVEAPAPRRRSAPPSKATAREPAREAALERAAASDLESLRAELAELKSVLLGAAKVQPASKRPGARAKTPARAAAAKKK
jgi:polyhydroxyalkanoate synthesis repressor PhaR